ncbi:ATP-dependent DNA helicase RecG [Pseudobythopirellula maris]|uniref:ATP-dependent DNA helicase RecG n=1 Tax=Pseudobythopirellula maris TaxID=2527991 RepID=A0A5C5ZTJ8_9BACT|nr:ATP-dependent DNA helicase RecG [Pseudobythopirellula maris]TWT90842.1 ATP-dependent DNA helicase RecG [Pseudobythopirellula maris]
MSVTLHTPVAELPGVKPAQARCLAKMGLHYAQDLLFLFPRGYEDFSDLRPIAELEADLPQTVQGEVTDIDSRGGFGRSRVGVVIRDESDALRATWFNQAFMRDKFKVGQRVQFSGKPRLQGHRWEMAHPRVAYLDGDPANSAEEGLLPVYSLTEGMTLYHMRRIVGDVVTALASAPEEVLPDDLRSDYDLMPLADALRWVHRPADEKQRDDAVRRFVFQELLVLQLALAARRLQQRVGFKAPELPADARVDARITRLLPFDLTGDQRAAITAVAADMASSTPMNRLLQGDVGSGKTVVALYAMLMCVTHGWQAALVAPTEVLARQHGLTLEKLLAQSRVNWRLLVGGMTDAEKADVKRGLAAGEIDAVIGTHAVLEESVAFAKLGLAVVDEQHKFGVRQRAKLRSGERSPHFLVMTATPIPRTMSMTQFGDLDVSTIRETPPGRAPIRTYLVEPTKRDEWWGFVRGRLDEGRQAFVVTPLVDESATLSATSVQEAYEALTNGELEAYRVALLHGRMAAAEKESVMEAFRTGETQVLVSTTVIEVGVDVPNAAVMTVASPERFGLSQLHQLRGRVGRGSFPGACGLLLEEEVGDKAAERLKAFAETTDGFKLAELDFELRGPGDLFGDRQSGLPPLRMADLRLNLAELLEARAAAAKLFAADPGLKDERHHALRRQMLRRYGESLELGDVG